MSTYQISVSYDRLDIEDLDRMELIAAAVPDASFCAVDGQTRVEATLSADSAVEAVESLVNRIRSVDNLAEPLRHELSLMAVPDIAVMVGVNRETVRLWTIGKRGPGKFPSALDSVGDRVRVWAAHDVYRWLVDNSIPCPSGYPLSPHEVTDANRAIQRMRHCWSNKPTLAMVPEWTMVRHEEATVPVIRGTQDAARC
ncbi:hypothetical protein [Kribbella catacumbae]|uniref:hypothetical protein n=1 Tax=Kribbella catacumbae TaxID=460086 RepID=UPI0012F91A69|nr:hypothetical protein [Kribbella catacumbae]